MAVDCQPLGARGGHRGAVVGAVAEEHHVLGALAPVAVVLAGHLDGGLDRLATAKGEKDVVQVARQEARHLGGELDAGLVGDLEDVVDRELLGLGLDGVEDLLAPVADVHRPQRREGVDVGVALGVVDHGALGALHDGRLEARHLGEGRPQVTEKVVLEPCLLRFELFHRSSLRPPSRVHARATPSKPTAIPVALSTWVDRAYRRHRPCQQRASAFTGSQAAAFVAQPSAPIDSTTATLSLLAVRRGR